MRWRLLIYPALLLIASAIDTNETFRWHRAMGSQMVLQRGNATAVGFHPQPGAQVTLKLADEASSFGGAVLLKLVHEKVWTGPCVFLAQAGIKYGLDARLPAGIHAILIHAEEDKLVPFADSMKIAEASGSQVELWPTGGDHKLHHITTDGTLKRAVEQLLPKD